MLTSSIKPLGLLEANWILAGIYQRYISIIPRCERERETTDPE